MVQKSGALSDEDIQHLKDLAKESSTVDTTQAKIHEGKALQKNIQSVCRSFISSNDLTLAAIGAMTLELLSAVKQDKVKLYQVSNAFSQLAMEPTLLGIFGGKLGNAINLKGDIPELNRAGMLFLGALQTAYKGEPLSWKKIYAEQFPDISYNTLNVYKIWLKKQYAEIDKLSSGMLGYTLLCESKSRIYSPQGVKLLSEGYAPYLVERHLKDGAELNYNIDDLGFEHLNVDFAEKGQRPIRIDELAKLAMK